MLNFLDITLEILYVFCGFILGLYYERNAEKRRDKNWLKSALLSIKHDIDLDYKLFSKTIKNDQDKLDFDKKILDEINTKTSISDFFNHMDMMKNNDNFGNNLANKLNEDFDFIDLNRVNYDSFLKFGTKDESVDDNYLKAQLDWVFEGAIYIYRDIVNQVKNMELKIDDYCSQIGYSQDYKFEIQNKFDSNYIIQFKAIYSNYLILRKKHIIIKNDILEDLKRISGLIDKHFNTKK